MAYLIYRSDGTPITIPDNTVDNLLYDPQGGGGFGTNNVTQSGQGLGVQLLGRNASNYGQAIAQSFVQLTENFASSVVPNDNFTMQGQLWFNQASNSAGNLYVKVNNATSGGILNWNKIISADNAGNVTIDNLTVQGTLTMTNPLPVASGGTGVNSLTGFINQLLPSQTGNAGSFLTTNGSNVSWATAGGGGTSFPLQKSTISDTTNADIAWVGTDNILGKYNNTRIRGLIDDGTNVVHDAYNNTYTANAIFENYTSGTYQNNTYATNWAETMSFIEASSYCGSSSAVHIPYLVVDTISGVTMVTNLSAAQNTISVSSPTGYVAVGLTSPAMPIYAPTNTITVTETNITNSSFTYGTPEYYGGPAGYRISLIGYFTSTTVGNAYFKLYYGLNYQTDTNSLVGEFSTATTGTGTSQYFKLDIDVYIKPPTSGSIYAPIAVGELTCPSGTGIASTIKTYFTPVSPATEPTLVVGNYIRLGLTGLTSDSNNSMVIEASRIEAII